VGGSGSGCWLGSGLSVGSVLPLVLGAWVSEQGSCFPPSCSRREEDSLLTLLEAWALDLPFLRRVAGLLEKTWASRLALGDSNVYPVSLPGWALLFPVRFDARAFSLQQRLRQLETAKQVLQAAA